MACLPIEIFRYTSLVLTFLTIINWLGHLVFMFVHETHTLDKYLVIAYWTASVGCGLMNELTKSLYLLSLSLMFAIQAVVQSFGSFRLVGYVMVFYALCMVVAKTILEIVILRYKNASLTDSVPYSAIQLNQAKYAAIMQALKKNKDSRAEVTVLRLFAYLFTIAYFNYCNFRFWKDIFEIPNHAFRPAQLIFPITLLIVSVLLMKMIDLIIYRKDHHLIYLILIFGVCLVSFFLGDHLINFGGLLAYLVIISVIYICKVIYSAN